ncbi:hypothetical protein [Cupriavidus necator]
MSAVDRFIDGEDRLSALLKRLPAYAPSDALEAAVRAAARTAQQEADRLRTSAAPLPFPAPPTLAAAVLQEAARVQAAQAARRDALLDRVAAGQPAADVLGAPVSAATRDWLAAQAQANAAAQKAEQARTSHAVRARQWWRSLGLAASVAAVAGLTTSIVLRQIDDGALLPATTREISAPAPAPAADIAAAPATEAAPEAAAAAPASPAPPAVQAAPPRSASNGVPPRMKTSAAARRPNAAHRANPPGTASPRRKPAKASLPTRRRSRRHRPPCPCRQRPLTRPWRKPHRLLHPLPQRRPRLHHRPPHRRPISPARPHRRWRPHASAQRPPRPLRLP